ncbi:hypothetical protein SAY87_002445 [Trapa incisa]|uniref:Uncharacterized protein n=1 Tax=Trapa incisa TaxID=236973 RepID=A0AAN7JUH4_9MYRT|nr:hypothetical protein SAY87_002445 [Trapa incisa]
MFDPDPVEYVGLAGWSQSSDQRVSDLCLGKPALQPLTAVSSISNAGLAIRSSGETHLSVWSCDHRTSSNNNTACCVGKVSMVDVICYLRWEENLRFPSKALKAPLTEILPK